MQEVVVEQFTTGRRIWNHTFTAPLGGLRTNPECTPRRIDVIAGETAQFLATQPRIVGERQHDAVANWLLAGCGKNRVPVVFVRNPWQLVMPRNQRPARVTMCCRVVGAHSLAHSPVPTRPGTQYTRCLFARLRALLPLPGTTS